MTSQLFLSVCFSVLSIIPLSESGVVVTLLSSPRAASAAATSEIIIAGTPLGKHPLTATGAPLVQPLQAQGRALGSRPKQASTTYRFQYTNFPLPSSYYGSYATPMEEYDDDLLTSGTATEALNNRLYFDSIPHEKLVLKHENRREANGLYRHLLESIRPFHPFYVDY